MDAKKQINGLDRNGYIRLTNPHISTMENDVLYHFGLSKKTHDFKQIFGDTKFVCVGGSASRMKRLANIMSTKLGFEKEPLRNLSENPDRYILYKVGPLVFANHGIGIPSISVVLHELIKLLHYAEARDVIFARVGTSGGIGLLPGTVVITDSALDGQFRPHLIQTILGKPFEIPSGLDKVLSAQLLNCREPTDNFDVVIGDTMCTMDFYEGQGRLDGAFCDYTENDKAVFLQEAFEKGVKNFEMESLCFAALCNRAGIKGVVLCVTLLDRLKDDQVTADHSQLEEWVGRPLTLLSRFIIKTLDTK